MVAKGAKGAKAANMCKRLCRHGIWVVLWRIIHGSTWLGITWTHHLNRRCRTEPISQSQRCANNSLINHQLPGTVTSCIALECILTLGIAARQTPHFSAAVKNCPWQLSAIWNTGPAAGHWAEDRKKQAWASWTNKFPTNNINVEPKVGRSQVHSWSCSCEIPAVCWVLVIAFFTLRTEQISPSKCALSCYIKQK